MWYNDAAVETGFHKDKVKDMAKETARDADPHAGNPPRLDEGKFARRGLAALLASAIMCSMVGVADSTDSVFLLPSSHVLWRTAPSATFDVPVFMPPGASSATLVVRGQNYRREYAGLSDGMFSLSLPGADSDDTENVYDLTLTFNDAAATTRSAKIGVVVGASTGNTAVADVRAADSSKWRKTLTRAVLPIPSGVTSLSINGTTVDGGLYESPGWFLFLSKAGSTYDVLLSDGGTPLAEATLLSISTGFKFIIR